MKNPVRKKTALSDEQLAVRKRYIGATFVTCMVAALVFGSIHVVQIGSKRMDEMRAQAGYDLKDEDKKIRAAGEDLFRNVLHERGVSHTITYTVEEISGLLPIIEWQRLEMMVEVPEGEFIMGTDNKKTDSQNRPAHKRSLDTYYIDKYPVTNAQYGRFVAGTGHRTPINWSKGKFVPGKVFHPVTMVSWFDARDYCEWAGKRLPTEAEWEKAARGTDERRWPWGDVMDTKLLNTYYNVGSTTPVGMYEGGASPYGALDMAGNVAQWIADDFDPYSETDASQEIFKAKMPVVSKDKKNRDKKVADFVETELKYKVMRGGSWKGDPFSTSSFHRNYSWPNLTSDFYGFRCVKDSEPLNTEVASNESSNG